jgi:hypothetical protein
MMLPELPADPVGRIQPRVGSARMSMTAQEKRCMWFLQVWIGTIFEASMLATLIFVVHVLAPGVAVEVAQNVTTVQPAVRAVDHAAANSEIAFQPLDQ